MILGIDLGRTIVHTVDGVQIIYPDAFHIIGKLVRKAKHTFIVSKVSRTQQVRSIKWIKDSDFCNITGIPFSNIHYCRERPEKGPICRALGITHFIDDRAEVMYHMPKKVNKFLFQPDLEQMEDYPTNSKVVNSWIEIGKLLL